MTHGFFGRLFGGNKAKSTTGKKLTASAAAAAVAAKKQPHQKSAPTTSTSSSSSSSSSRNNKPPSPSPSLPSPQRPTSTSSSPPPPSSPPSLPTPSPSPPPPPQTPSIETKSKNDMNDFYNIQGTSNDVNAHVNQFHSLLQQKHEQQDEYFTISSATSSHLSLQDALFSHLTTSDTLSEITQFSDFPKIAVGTQQQQQQQQQQQHGNAGFFHVADNVDANEHVDPYDDAAHSTKQLYQLYMDALRHLSPKSVGPTTTTSPAQAFRLFEYIANQPALDDTARHLIAYAQYYAGRMLYEATLDHDQDEFIKQQGLKYLLDASKNGIACATFMLGYYAECDGDIDYACNLYYQAAVKGQLLAKVYFGNTVLFREIQGYQAQDAVLMLKEASHQGHSIASLSLALYYEKVNQIELAIQYAARVHLPAKHPYFCIASYQMGIIYLKAGIEYADVAFRYLLASASSHHDGSKYTPALRKLGTLSLMGIGTTKNPTTAFNLMQEAAKLGDEPANIILGQMYQKGQGCVADLFRAMQIFENYPDNMAAKLSRGLLVMKDNPHHAYREFASIITQTPTAFDLEHWDVQSIKNEASVRIAVWEYNGIGGTEKKPERAFHTLKKLSDDCNYSGAHFWLANAYLDGVKLDDGTVIVPQNQDLAFRCFLRGAHQNQPKCQYYAGLMLKDGYSCQEYNKSHALAFFMDAASQNHDMALTQVGAYYFTGSIGTQGRDLDKAFRYFSAAAKQNNALAIQYLADYMIKNTASGPINHYQIYTELNRSAGAEQDPIAYRMLALVVVNSSSIHPSETYEDKQHPVYHDLAVIYKNAKVDAMMSQQDIKFKFALHLLWRAIELNDHASGQYLCNFYSRMNDQDVIRTIELFEKVEMGVPNKLTIAFARFLKVSKNRASALTKFIEVASCHDITTSMGWTARLEAAKLILLEHQGKARTKTLVFTWLNDMVKFHGKNLFVPFILLAKCHDDEMCAGCKKTASTFLYESGLQCKPDDAELELFARMRLIETYYKTHNAAITKQLDTAEPLLEAITDLQERNARSADVYYYRGLLALHNGTIYNYRERARHYLTKADQLGHIYACLELGYLYGTTQSQEEKADACFQKVDASKHTLFSLKSRITESMVQCRTQDIRTSNDYLVEINKMKLAAGITYSYYHMERQALDWLQEISDHPLAQIMILYYKMKETDQRTVHNMKRLSELMNPYEATLQLDYYSSMALSYGQFRLGQCYEDGDCVPRDDNKVLDYYTKACAYLQNNETYERLAEISGKSGADINLFPTLCNAARNDPTAIYKLAQYYHHKELNPAAADPDVPCKKAADQYLKAAQAGHTEACYYYAKYRIDQMRQSTPLNAAVKSKKAVNYLRMAANKNHGPSFYELGKLELAAGLYEEGREDLKEADFLGCGAASFELGELYRKGFVGVISDKVTFRITPNLNTALQYYRRAMDFGHVLAMVRIGDFLETGALGDQSTSQAKAWYKRALSQGCPDGAAEYALGCLEETCISMLHPTTTTADPQVLQKHRTTAFRWFTKAHKANNKGALFKIGCYLLHGWIPPQASAATSCNDVDRGVQILQEENANGNVMAMKELARYYQEMGNEKRAFSYWRNAELLNDPEALEFIALCFEKGLLGQTVNSETALAYRARALEARKQAIETQRSMMGFKSDYSDERNDRSK